MFEALGLRAEDKGLSSGRFWFEGSKVEFSRVDLGLGFEGLGCEFSS